MSWARNGLALARLPHEDTPPFGTLRTPLQHLQSADGSFAGHINDRLGNVLRRVLHSTDY